MTLSMSTQRRGDPIEPLIRPRSTLLVLETKGQDSEENRTKRKFLGEWIKAINAVGGFGDWVADVALTNDDVHSLLAHHATG